MPDFNIVIRSGDLVGHLHLILIPRAHTIPKVNINAGFELATEESIITVDPTTAAADLKRRVGKSRQLSRDPSESQHSLTDCLFCEQKTPATLFCVRRDHSIIVPTESDSFAAAANFLRSRGTHDIVPYYELVGNLARHNRHVREGLLDVVRVFANLTPALVSDDDENCVVVGLADQHYHGLDFPDLPIDVVSGYIRAFQFLEAAAERRGLVLVPFFNCGAGAGGTVNCPHGQAYLLNRPPALYRYIAACRDSQQQCGVCEILGREELAIF
jgi:galactose-1-phosphate uridylyltransferase